MLSEIVNDKSKLLSLGQFKRRRGVLDTTLCDKVCPWFTPGTPVSSTSKTDCHDITEILLKVALSIIALTVKSKAI